MPKFKDLTGQRFSRLTVMSRAQNSKSNQTQWLCKCDCGRETVVRSSSLLNGHTKSCGCYSDEIRKINTDQTTHGLCHTRLYGIWSKMKHRCENPSARIYKYYGGKGVRICDEWKDFKTFYDWAMANGYRDDLSIDRIDVDGDYEPSNCRWADKITQMNNTTANVYYVYNGKRMTITEIAREIGIPANTLRQRINKLGYSFEEAILYKSGEVPKEKRTPASTDRMITYNGKTQNMTDWAREYGINYGTFYNRIVKYGMSIEEALTKPLQKHSA